MRIFAIVATLLGLLAGVACAARWKQYLLDNATLDAIYESAIERQFATADINTIISVIRKRLGARNGESNGTDADATRCCARRPPADSALSATNGAANTCAHQTFTTTSWTNAATSWCAWATSPR